jgi:hypothetical protein
MTNKSRYFLLGASAALVIGLGGGIVAYYTYSRVQAGPAGLPAELRYVPFNAELVAFADVRAVMNSELRRELERAADGSERGRRQADDFAGIDFEKQVNRVVGYVESTDNVTGAPPRGLLLAQGSFDQTRIEQFVRDRSGTIEDHNGKRIAIYRRTGSDQGVQRDNPPPAEAMAMGFVQADLIAVGQTDLVRRALDFSGSAAPGSANVMSNAELMSLIRDSSGETAWVVGHFDAVSRRLGIPGSLSQQVPPLRMIAARAHINGGLKATISAQTADQAAADQLRDVIRGFLSLVRLQAGAKPELQSTLKSLELGGTGSTVQLSFAMTPDTVRAIVPQRRPLTDPQPPALPPPPGRP